MESTVYTRAADTVYRAADTVYRAVDTVYGGRGADELRNGERRVRTVHSITVDAVYKGTDYKVERQWNYTSSQHKQLTHSLPENGLGSGKNWLSVALRPQKP